LVSVRYTEGNVHIGRLLLVFPVAGLFAILLTSCVGRLERPSVPPVIVVPAPGGTGNYILSDYGKDLTAYEAAAKDATGTAAVPLRNKMVYSIMAEIDYVFYDYETKLFLNEGRFHVGADFLQLGMAAGGTLTNGTRGKTILSALLTGVTGVDLSVDKNFFRQQTVQAITSSMEANRDHIKTIILQQLGKDTTAYPFQAARSDLIRYFFAGTLPSGLQQLSQDAGTKAQDEKATLNQAQVKNITVEDVSTVTELNNAITQAFKNNDLAPVRDYLEAMGVVTDRNATKEVLEAGVRKLGNSITVDPDLRKKAFAVAKTAKLIQ
jgi:hypothetical protein